MPSAKRRAFKSCRFPHAWMDCKKDRKNLPKSVDRRWKVWYYTWAPSAETKNDFWNLSTKPLKRTNRRWKVPVSTEKLWSIQVQNVQKPRKKSLTKNRFCGKIIKSSAAKAEAHRTLKIEQYRKTCNGTYFRVGKTRKTIPNKVIHTGRKRLRAERTRFNTFKW